MVFDIKPRTFQLDTKIGWLIEDEFLFFPWTQRNFRTSYLRNFALAWIGAQKEKIAEQIEMGLDAQKSLTKMSEQWKDEGWN